MRSAAALFAALVGMLAGGAALAAAGYAYRIDLAAAGGQFAYRVALPEAVHRGVTRGNFADLRVTNSAGEAVPFGFATGAAAAAAGSETLSLPLFPVTRSVVASDGDFHLKVRRNADGSVQAIASAGSAALPAAERTAFWLADATGAPRAITGLAFEWKEAPGLAAALRVEAGDDLVNWRTLVARGTIVDLSFAGQRLRQDSVEFGASRARYLRVSVDGEGGPAPDITAVRARLAPSAPEAPRAVRAVTGRRGANALEVEFDLGGLWQVDRAAFSLPQVNTLAPAEVLVRTSPDEPWRALARTVVYRIAAKAGAAEVTSPPVVLPATQARYWLLRADARSGGFGDGEVHLAAGFAERHLVFVARGDGPFRIEYGRLAPAGSREPAGAALPLATLLPDYRPGAEWSLPLAVAGPEVAVDPSLVRRTLASEIEPRKAVLWAVLVAAVLLLAWIAWRLMRKAPDAH